VHSRRARPTLRLLREDLASGWESPYPLRLLAQGNHEELHPLSELPHPIVAKAAESIGHHAGSDNVVGLIASSTKLRLLEIKVSQWRGGVWGDPATGVHWLVVAGLAKGEHQDREDFYQRIGRENDDGDPNRWLPTADDLRLLKQETAARLITEWELTVQSEVLNALRKIESGGSTRLTVKHPHPDKASLATLNIEITLVREPDYHADEIEVEVIPAKGHIGSQLVWQLTIRTLISLSPPEQEWDRHKDSYTNIAEPGAWTTRVIELETLVSQNELAQSEPGRHSHYSHREHLAGSTIHGHPIRALCGVFLVPTQDHEKLPVCPACQEQFEKLRT
jgi:Protein of unknown function (DUF3039)